MARRRNHFLVHGLASALLVVAAHGAASAAEYEGAGNTGWIWNNQRDCCDDAVAIAQQDSAIRCRDSGGVPKIPSGLARGMCDWETQGDTLDRVYRCTATANVPCRQ